VLSIQPIDVRLAVGLTIGDPEVVSPFANCLFQIWHGILLTMDIAQPRQNSCSRKVNEILRGGGTCIEGRGGKNHEPDRTELDLCPIVFQDDAAIIVGLGMDDLVNAAGEAGACRANRRRSRVVRPFVGRLGSYIGTLETSALVPLLPHAARKVGGKQG
jgi:hypothetical protein